MAVQRCPKCAKEGRRGVPVREGADSYRCSHEACGWRVRFIDGKWQETNEAPAAPVKASAEAQVKALTKTATIVAEKEPKMQISQVTLTMKVGGKLEDGTWRGVDLGATATVNGEDFETAEAELYETVKAHLLTLWGDTTSLQLNTTSLPAPVQSGNGHSGNSDGKSICPLHGVEMRRWEKDNRVWYSHKTDDGAWCKGK